MVYLILGQGFEEIEAVTQLDILRRADIEVKSAGIGGLNITGAHGISVLADITAGEINKDDLEMLILPGGMGGVNSIMADNALMELIKCCVKAGKIVAAICAAPIILARLGLIDGLRVVCYPGCEKELGKAVYDPGLDVIREGNIITGRAPGAAIPFALKLVETLTDKQTALRIKSGLCC